MAGKQVAATLLMLSKLMDKKLGETLPGQTAHKAAL